MVSSEELAIKRARLLFEAKQQNHGFGRGCFGCKVDPKQISNSKYVEKLIELFGSVTIPVNWARIESNKGNYDFSEIDACIDAFGGRKLAIAAGPLLCFSKEYLPGWLLCSKMSFEKVLETAYQFVTKTVARYSGAIGTWGVLGGLNVFNHFNFNFEQVLEMTRAASMAVKQESTRAVKIIEISNPWGEYYAETGHTIPPLVYLDMVIQGGINFDAFGLQVRFSSNKAGLHLRDMMQVSAILDCFGTVGKSLYINGVEVPGGTEGTNVNRQEWGHLRQAQWIERFYKIALSKPFIESVTYANLTDCQETAMAGSGLLTAELEPKNSFHVLKKLRSSIFVR